jgi:hypothetical protein
LVKVLRAVCILPTLQRCVLTTIASVIMLFCSAEPFIKRCLSTGGSILLLAPSTLEVAEASYEKLVESFGLLDMSLAKCVQAFLNMPQDDLWKKVPVGVSLLPVIDDETVHGHPNFAYISSSEDSTSFPIPGRRWCESPMIGDSTPGANVLAYAGVDARNPNIAQVHQVSSQHPISPTVGCE